MAIKMVLKFHRVDFEYFLKENIKTMLIDDIAYVDGELTFDMDNNTLVISVPTLDYIHFTFYDDSVYITFGHEEWEFAVEHFEINYK